MLRAKAPPSKGEPAGPSMTALQKLRRSGDGKMWTPSPECIQTATLPLDTSFSSFMMRLASAGLPADPAAAASSIWAASATPFTAWLGAAFFGRLHSRPLRHGLLGQGVEVHHLPLLEGRLLGAAPPRKERDHGLGL
mmetsp:Transcript_22794/g.70702  ORF Transcript_22794/g.70702 Transcript_22794/m.70702 type:complete len:137 (-) Transcript_22794:1027-1437(-)